MPDNFTLTAASVSDNPAIDIVFLHGLGGSAADSWTYNGSYRDKTYWPALLGVALPYANVSVVGYPTSKLGKVLGGSNLGILQVASGVADLLATYNVGIRPTFFIAHSLGGIVTKAVLRLCSDSEDPRKAQLFRSAQGAVLFGTPNTGVTMGNICSVIPGMASMQAAELARADMLLMDLSQWFRGKAGIGRIRCHSFYETELTNGILVVDQASANPAVEGCDPVPLTKNHIDMCKLENAQSSTFESITAFISSTVRDRNIYKSAEPEKITTKPRLEDAYSEALFQSKELRHPSVKVVNEIDIFVDPIIYHEKSKTRSTTLDNFASRIITCRAAIISGSDRSGKSLVVRRLQIALDNKADLTILIQGTAISNADIKTYIERATKEQYGQNEINDADLTVIIDDFDECQLQDTTKEKMVTFVTQNYKRIILTSFTQAPSVLFAQGDRPDPDLFEIYPLSDEKILQLTEKWRTLGKERGNKNEDPAHLATFELLRKIFDQTELEKFSGTVVQFLQLIDSSAGSDINVSSYAACYETLITSHIVQTNPNWQNLDEARNFISHIAFQSYIENGSTEVSQEVFDRSLNYYKNNYFSSAKELREIAIKGFLVEQDDGYVFKEEYEWYFLCARHAAKTLKSGPEYDSFVIDCTANIFRKQYANIIIFMAYFSEDNMILSLLLDILDGLFSKAPSWTLSDEQKTIMLGLTPSDSLTIPSNSDVAPNRSEILRQRVANIIDDAEEVVAQYALPFLNPEIDDSEYVPTIEANEISSDSYMKSLNALMRVHSVIGQILASRSGTFDARTMLDCITRMVQASGRYIALNHAISAVLVFDKAGTLDEVDRAYDNSRMTKEEKYHKVERIFSFWSVFVSQAGLARYLSHDHAIRALKVLSGRYESKDDYKSGHIPFNFTSVLIIASLYKSGTLDKDLFEKALNKYGDKSAIVSILRAAVHIYTYYMPLSIQDKQWLSSKLKMPVRRLEAQRRKAVLSGYGKLPTTNQHNLPARKRPK